MIRHQQAAGGADRRQRLEDSQFIGLDPPRLDRGLLQRCCRRTQSIRMVTIQRDFQRPVARVLNRQAARLHHAANEIVVEVEASPSELA